MNSKNTWQKFFIVLRLLLISLIYFPTNTLLYFDFLMTENLFLLYLITYFIVVFLYIIFSEKKIFIILLISIELFFTCILFLEMGFYIRCMFRTPGEAGFGYLFIFPILLMLVCFFVWIKKDLRKKCD